jgi:hypothetical protein
MGLELGTFKSIKCQPLNYAWFNALILKFYSNYNFYCSELIILIHEL